MQYQWQTISEPSNDVTKKLASSINVNPFAAKLLVQRGIDNFKKAKQYFRPSLANLHDPFLMLGMSRAVNLLTTAVSSQKKVMIYGDYDVDGTTSVALMFGFLKEFCENLVFYIPDRYIEGYGISEKGVQSAIKQRVELFVSLDCGIRANDTIALLREANVDVIVCDHHVPGDVTPDAIILNPKQKDCFYPFKELCGVGVGFKFLQGFCDQNSISKSKLYRHLDLVALGTSADIVPIVDENRILVKHGLEQINSNPRAGIRALLVGTKVGVGGSITVSVLVFTIAPRINAAGRISDAKEAVALLLEEDYENAVVQAGQIESFNKERKSLDKGMTQEALKMLAVDEKEKRFLSSTVLYQPHWHKGVIGIVASRCIEHYYRPTIIFTKSGPGQVAGSARSVEGLDIHQAIAKCSSYLDQFGGHRAAAGLTMKEQNIDQFREAFDRVIKEETIKLPSIPSIDISMELPLERVTMKFTQLLEQMEPFGPENRAPIFMSKNVVDTGATKLVGADKSHLKLDVAQGSFSATGIGFGLGDKIEQIKTGEPFDLCYTITRNEFRGVVNPQLMVKDIIFPLQNKSNTSFKGA